MTINLKKAILAILCVCISLNISAQDDLEIASFRPAKPIFVGGSEAMYAYFSDSLQYPQLAFDNCIQGSVVIKFEVSAKGNVENTDILMFAHPLLNKEALRLVKAMPQWLEGDDKLEMTIPIEFKLDCEPLCLPILVSDSLPNLDDLRRIDDSQHSDKHLFEGEWFYKSFDIEIKSDNKKAAKKIRKRFEDGKKKEGKELFEEIKQIHLRFHEDNNVDIYMAGDSTKGIYRLHENKLLLYSMIGGMQSITYEIKGNVLSMHIPFKKESDDVECAVKLKFKR